MDRFAAALSTDAGRPVIDRTGLSGQYDIDLTYAPDPSAPLADARPNVANNVSLFTAVQEQLGLRLDAVTQPLEVLVIDRVERPAEN